MKLTEREKWLMEQAYQLGLSHDPKTVTWASYEIWKRSIDGHPQLASEAPDNWIPVKERLPNERCLAYTPNGDLVMKYRIIPAGMFKQVAKDATHWQPIEPPTGED